MAQRRQRACDAELVGLFCKRALFLAGLFCKKNLGSFVPRGILYCRDAENQEDLVSCWQQSRHFRCCGGGTDECNTSLWHGGRYSAATRSQHRTLLWWTCHCKNTAPNQEQLHIQALRKTYLDSVYSWNFKGITNLETLRLEFDPLIWQSLSAGTVYSWKCNAARGGNAGA